MSNTQLSRRRFLVVAGSVTLTTAAGCTTAGTTTLDEEAWAGIDAFAFEGRMTGWTGLEPAIVEGEENPTLLLFDGEAYDFRWVNRDGGIHNLEIHDDDGEIVGGYASDTIDDEGAEVVLANVVASPEMSTYVCRFHQQTQAGTIEVVSP